jgi:hypothetical protein
VTCAPANLLAQLDGFRRKGCPVCAGRIAAVPTAADRGELTCLDPDCSWFGRIQGGRLVQGAEAGDTAGGSTDPEFGPEQPACDTRRHPGRPPCRLCRRITHEGGLCEHHWRDYLHQTRHDDPRPHSLDWAARQAAAITPAAPTSPPFPKEQQTAMKTPPEPCLCGCGTMLRPDKRREAHLCDKTGYRWKRYKRLKGKLDLTAWLAAGQPSPIKGTPTTGKTHAPAPGKGISTTTPPQVLRPQLPPQVMQPQLPPQMFLPQELAITAECDAVTTSPKVSLQRTGNYVGAYDEYGLLLAQLRIA